MHTNNIGRCFSAFKGQNNRFPTKKSHSIREKVFKASLLLVFELKVVVAERKTSLPNDGLSRQMAN